MKNNDKQYDIIFLGLAQNCEKFLINFFNKIDEIADSKKIKVIIGENNSNDFTFDIIQKKIATSDNYQFVDTTIIENFDDRIKRLAIARQLVKDNICKFKLKSKYVCVVDMDDVINDQFNLNLINKLTEILSSNQDKYFGVSVSSKPYYYDILNFENEEIENKFVKRLQNDRTIQSYYKRKEFIYNIQHYLSKKKNFECISGFNGVCVYFYDEYMKSDYIEDNIDQTPEHLFFNRNLNKILGKKMLVSDFYLRMPDEHKPLNNIFQFIFEKFLKYFYIYKNKIFN